MSTSARRLTGALAACALLGGCVVGPNFVAPPPPALDRYTPAGTARLGGAPDPQWWRGFGSPALDGLVAAGLAGSPTLDSATAALGQSRALARAGAGVFFPHVGVAADATREHTTPALLGNGGDGATFSLYTASGSVSYALDLFGGERRGVEALNAQAAYQRHALGAAWLVLAGDIADAAIDHAGYAADATTLADIVQLDMAQRDSLGARFRSGYGAWADVLVTDEQLAADRASLAVVRQRLAASTTLLAMLLGREPAAAAPPLPALGDLSVPADLPVSLPSQLVHQRPDILEAEATLHQANAQIGVATAAMFPSISLTGSYGAASTSLAHLAGPAGQFWSIGPSIDIPIFHGGQLWYGRRAAQAAHAKAFADYRQTVLLALEQVADALKSLSTDAEVSAIDQTALDAATNHRALAEANRQAGVIADIDAMTFAIAADRAGEAMTDARALQLQDIVTLDVATGGGGGGGWAGALPEVPAK